VVQDKLVPTRSNPVHPSQQMKFSANRNRSNLYSVLDYITETQPSKKLESYVIH